MVHVKYDQKADAIYIRLRKAVADISAEASENVIMDLDKDGRIIGMEVFDTSKNMGLETITKLINSEKLAAQHKTA